MESLPPHIRPEDEIYFRLPLPLKRMSLPGRWVLGLKILVAAQLVCFPVTLFFTVGDHLNERLSISAVFLGLIACAALGPLWAAGMLRGWAASSMAQRMLNDVLASPNDIPKT